MEWIKVLVVLYAVCVIKCSTVSNSEIEDFTNFLHKTSRLDQALKKGTSPDDAYDEDDPVSDHAWEDSGKFEGDLILNERQRRQIVEEVAEGLSRNGLRDSTKRWPDNEVIYYIQKEHFNPDQMQAIHDGIQDIAQASCVKFRPYKKGDRDAVVIQGSRRGCFSQVGYQSGYQVLNLNARHPAGRGCFRHGTVVHELLHTLGFYHMQSSPDRDDYVNIAWGNIAQQARNNFRKYNTFSVSDFGVGYDYDSVLHYSRRAFSINGKDTIVPKKSGVQIGQRLGLSDKDTEKLNRMYCDANSNDAAEETTEKPTKKSRKNKPFDGHGIGYHQGKAVAIKIVPEAQTVQLSDVPFRMFNYFSKAPQTVPTTSKTEGDGKYINYAYKTTAPYSSQYYGRNFEKEEQDVPSVHTPPRDIYAQDKDEVNDNNTTVNKSPENMSSEENKGEHFDVNKLERTIKTLTEPAYIPNYEEYLSDNKYSGKRTDLLPELHNRDDAITKPFFNIDGNNVVQYIEKLYDSSAEKFQAEGKQQDKPYDENDETESGSSELRPDDDSMKSYRTSFKNLYKPDEYISSQDYVTPTNFLDKHNYSAYYDGNLNQKDETKKQYKILGEPVPFTEAWYKNHYSNNDDTDT